MGDRARRAARKAARVEDQANLALDIGRDVDGGESVSGSSGAYGRSGRAQLPRAVPPLAMDPGMWINMVNLKPPYLDLEVESMKKIILEYKRYDSLGNVLANYYVLCSNLCWKII